MSENQEEKLEPVLVEDFVVAKVGTRFLRFQSAETVPVGSEAITKAVVDKMTKENIGELYSSVVGVSPKNFKDRSIAIKSLIYQIGKMPVFDPSKPVEVQATAKKTPRSQETAARKANTTYELLSPPDLDKVLAKIAPQARELVLIMTELAQEKGSTMFPSADLMAKLKIPEIGARLKTRQDPLRILSYYQGKLIGSGLIRIS